MDAAHNVLKSPPHNIECLLIMHSENELNNIVEWAWENKSDEFSLGVLATMNYILLKDKEQPKDKINNADDICRVGEPRGLVGDYLKEFFPDELIDAEREWLARKS